MNQNERDREFLDFLKSHTRGDIELYLLKMVRELSEKVNQLSKEINELKNS